MATALSKQFLITGTRPDENINSDTILSFDVVCVGSPVLIMLQIKYKKKQV